MKKKISLLAGVLGVQLILALSVFFWGGNHSDDFLPEPLLNFNSAKLDKLVISDGENEVVLLKNEKQWQLTDKSFPVDQNKFDRLLAKVRGLKTTWPVTSTPSSHERFEVSNNKMRRKISLYQNDKMLAAFYVGSSPEFKKSHVRVEGQYEVYALEFNAYDAPATTIDWLDKSLLAVKSVTEIRGTDYTLSKTGESWLIQPIHKNRKIDAGEVDKLVTAVGAFKIMDVANAALEFNEDKRIEILVKDGSRYSISLYEEGGEYYVKRTGFDDTFRLSKYEYERLTKPNLESLTAEVKADEAEEGGDDGAGLEVGEKELQ